MKRCLVFHHRVTCKAKLFDIPQGVNIIKSKGNRSTKLCGKCLAETKKIQTMTNEKTIFIQFQRNSNSFEGKLISSTEAATLLDVSKKRDRETVDMSSSKRIKRGCHGIDDDMLSFLVKDGTIKHKKTNVVIAQHKGHDTRRIFSINCNNIANCNNRCSECNKLFKQTLRFRIKRLKCFLDNDITERDISKHDPPVLLLEYINKWKAKFHALSEQHNSLLTKQPTTTEAKKLITTIATTVEEQNFRHSFFSNWVKMSFNNINKRSPNGRRYDNSTLLFAMFLKWYGGKQSIKLLNSSGSTSTISNMMFPHNTTLKRWSPEWCYGTIMEVDMTKLLESITCSEPIPMGIVWDETDIRSGIEVMYNDGESRIVGMETLCTIEEFEQMDASIIESSLGDKIIQIFLTFADGSNTFPIAYFARNNNTNMCTFLTEKLCDLVTRLEATKKLKLAWTSSDGDPQNKELEAALKLKFPHSVHLYDAQHIVKNVRNALLNNELKVPLGDNHITFQHKLLGQAIDELKLKLDAKILNPNKLKWEPVKALINMDTSPLSNHKSINYQGLGSYLQHMSDLYQGLYDNNIDWTLRRKQLERCSTFFQSTEGVPTPTLHHITTTISNMVELVERNNATSFRFSSLGTLVVENFFSILRAKTPVFSVGEYARLHAQAYLIMQIKFASTTDLGFSVPSTPLGKNYCDIDIVLQVPKLKRKRTVPRQYVPVLTEHSHTLLQQFKPIKNFVTIGSKHKCRVPVYLSCPVDGCSCQKLYSYPKCLANHLQTAHAISKELATAVTKEMKQVASTSTATVIDSSQVLDIHNDSLTKENEQLDNSNNESSHIEDIEDTIPHGSIILRKATQSDTNVSSTTTSNQHRRQCCGHSCSRIASKKCTRLRCAKCCKQLGGCSIHNVTFKIDLQNSQILLLDTETTGFVSPRGLTDLYCMCLGSQQILEFPRYISSGIKSSSQAIRKTGITDAMVCQGESETEAIQQLVSMINKSPLSIVVCHNAAFDRDVILEVYHRHFGDLKENICGRRLMFVDTVSLFKDKIKDLTKHDLGTVYHHLFDERIEQQHRAGPDVQAMYRILKHIACTSNVTVVEMLTERASKVDIHIWHRNFGVDGKLCQPTTGLTQSPIVRLKCRHCNRIRAQRCIFNSCKSCCEKRQNDCATHKR